MGRRLAARSVALAGSQRGRTGLDVDECIDLTHSTGLGQAHPEPAQAAPHVRQAAKDALDRGETHYTVRPGVPELRSAIAARLTGDGFPATVDSVVVTNGGAEALYIALQAVVRQEERVLLVEPVLPNVRTMIQFIGGEIELMSGSAADRFCPDPDLIARSAAPVLVITSPSTVTGSAISADDLRRAMQAAVEREMTIVLDRSAADCLYQPDDAPLGNAEFAASTIVVGSFSMSHGLAGWRVGYFGAPAERIGELRNLKQAMSICTTAVSQFAALSALEGPDDWLSQRRQVFAERRDRVVASLAAANLKAIPPDAYPSLMIDTRSIDQDDRVVARRLRDEAQVIVEPGSSFGHATAGFVRIDLSVARDSLFAGIDRIVRWNGRGASDE
jgi:aspartate aminotransferase